jgi:hypothetical protein
MEKRLWSSRKLKVGLKKIAKEVPNYEEAVEVIGEVKK